MELIEKNVVIEFPARLEAISSEALDALLDQDEPFLKHAFLSALEQSSCVSAQTGWVPHHFAMFDRQGRLIAFAPVYLKHHSYGEYVFDWAWADSYERHGYEYYPKLLASIPFTPSVSCRLVCAQEIRGEAVGVFQRYLQEKVECHGLSSAHVLFPKYGEQYRSQKDWARRKGVQYHWHNRSYDHFDGFLAELNAAKRKNIRKERRRLHDAGIVTHWYQADQLCDVLFDFFIQCYKRTYEVRGQMAYLNRSFFEQLFRAMPEQCLLLFAFDGQEKPIASALFIRGNRTLYGRYWGATRDVSCLHFELCYYAGIEYCIRHKLERFDAGAQGEHKLLRGFEPVQTESYHYIRHPEFRAAIDAFLKDEREYIEQYKEDAERWLPYKKSP